MHIAIIRTEFDATRGGAERYAVNLARTWAEQGHRISIVCAGHNLHDAQGHEVVTVSRPRVLGPWKHRWFAARAGDAAAQTGADAVLALARASRGDVLRLGDGLHKAWLGARYPTLEQRRRALLNPRHRALLNLEQGMFTPGSFGMYVANSAMIRRAVIHMYGVDPARIVVIPNGVDPARFHLGLRGQRAEIRRRLGIPAPAQVVLFSGMDMRRKGLLEAARGFAELARQWPDHERLLFVAVGRGDFTPARELLNETDYAGQARFIEATDDIAAWYAAADVFVLPTMHDPSANAVTEALACGLPVVTSSENGARQHIVPGVNGSVLAHRGDAAAMAHAIGTLLAEPPDPTRVAQAANLTTLAQNADALLEVLRHAVALKQSPPQPQAEITGSRAARLRALKRRMWAEGDARDYRAVFRDMPEPGE